MSRLRQKLRGNKTSEQNNKRILYEQFGIIRNPFPSAGQSSENPHRATSTDDIIDNVIFAFDREYSSQALLIEGTQGVGKTNLLNAFEGELRETFANEGFYIIRYYADPEPSFDGILRKIFQEFGVSHLRDVGQRLHELNINRAERIIDIARMHEVRVLLYRLRQSHTDYLTVDFNDIAECAVEWLTGQRLLKRHRESLGVQFRLDTIESKTQALRDIIYCSAELGILKGVFLLLDELEKQDYSQSKTVVLRYLSAIRALIDALPKRLFLMVALTPQARQRYNSMLPAFAGRMQNSVRLEPLRSKKEAIELYVFYLKKAQEEASSEFNQRSGDSTAEIITKKSAGDVYDSCSEISKKRGDEGVTQRDFLNALNQLAEEKIQSCLK